MHFSELFDTFMHSVFPFVLLFTFFFLWRRPSGTTPTSDDLSLDLLKGDVAIVTVGIWRRSALQITNGSTVVLYQRFLRKGVYEEIVCVDRPHMPRLSFCYTMNEIVKLHVAGGVTLRNPSQRAPLCRNAVDFLQGIRRLGRSVLSEVTH